MSFLKLRKHRRFIVIFLTSLLVFTFINDGYAGTIDMFDYEDEYPSRSLQESRIEIFSISIPQLGGRQRNIQVYLPPDYDSSDKSYPVFYLTAGQYLFNPPLNAVGDYNVDEKLDQLFFEGSIEGVIVVGIEIDYEHDWDEDSPWVNEDMRDWVSASASDSTAGGESFAFLDFIVNSLKPEIDSRYRTLTNRENTAIGGFCKNGLLPVVAGIKYPSVFSMVMSMSPAVWFAEGGGRWLSNNRLIHYIMNNPVPENVKFYIDIGSEESSGNRPSVRDQDGKRLTYPRAYVEGAEAVVSALNEKGLPDSNIFFRIIEGSTGTRDERAENLDDVFLWFFSKESPETSLSTLETAVPESPTTENDLPMEEDPPASGNLVQNEIIEDPVEAEELNITFAIILGSALVFCFIAAIYLIFRRR